MADAAEHLRIPYDEQLRVHAQDAGFHRRTRCGTSPDSADHYPLMLHFPYFDLYRKQVVKQPDLVLAMQLRGDAFTADQKARNFAYYERITVRDSSLAACTEAIVAAEVGHLHLALDYVGEAALMDLRDLEHNARDGLHVAALAGTWIALVAGFGGFRERGGEVCFDPALPEGLDRLAFAIRWRADKIRVNVDRESVSYMLDDGGTGTVRICHAGEAIELKTGEPVRRRLVARVPLLPRPAQPEGRRPVSRRVG